MFCLNIAFLIARERKVKNSRKILKQHADEPEEDSSALSNATCNPPMKQGTNLSWLPQKWASSTTQAKPITNHTQCPTSNLYIYNATLSHSLSLDIMHKDSRTPSTNILS